MSLLGWLIVNQTKTGLQKRTLARTIGTDDAGQLPTGNIKVDIPQHRLAVVGDGHVVNRQRRAAIVLTPRLGPRPVCLSSHQDPSLLDRAVSALP